MSSMLLAELPKRSDDTEEFAGPLGTYQEVFENNLAIMLLVDPDAKTIVDANPTAVRFYGYLRTAMRGMQLSAISPSAFNTINADMHKSAGKTNDHSPVRHRLFSGDIRDVEIYSSPITVKNRQILLSIIHDVTERRKTEEKLRETEERYRSLIDDAVLGIYRTTPDGKILMVNPALCKMLGYSSPQELQKRNLEASGFHPRYERSDFKADLERKDIISGKEAVWTKSDGTTVVVRENARVVRDTSGKVLCYEGTVEDITDKMDAEDRLRRSEEQFRMISENVSDMIALLDCEGKRLYISPSYGKIQNDPEKLAATTSFEDIHPDDRDRVMKIFRETVETGVGCQTEYRYVSSDNGIRHIESQLSTVKNSEGNVSNVLIVSRDVTEKKAFDQQLLRSQRMESVGTLAGGIAHDLNNVLSPIMMSIEILRAKVPDPGGQKILDTIETSTKRGADIVKQVLAFARGVTGDRVLVQLKHVVKDVVNIASEILPKAITIRTILPRDLWTVCADPTQMHQVLLNLFVNARDAMPRGGILTIAAENTILDENYSRMHLEAKPGAYVSIAITDTGTGIPAGIREKIFEPFFTTKEIGMGTGLGLSTTLAIVKSHSGFINLYSEEGVGTTFRIYLPATGTASGISKSIEDADFPTGNGELIFVIDDERAIREITKETLETYGYRAMTAADGAEGVAIFAENKKDIAVVITDIMMPIMDGNAAIAALKRINPEVKIIAASGITSKVQFTSPVNPETQVFLTKPYTAEKLLKALASVLTGTP